MLVFVLAGCSTNRNEGHESETDNKERPTQNEGNVKSEDKEYTNSWVKELTAPKIPSTIKEIVEFPNGKFASLNVLLNEKDKKIAVAYFKKLPRLGPNASKEKMDAYWRKSHSIFHEIYPGRVGFLKGLKYSAFGSPDIKDERFHFKENLNVKIIIDASGSMAGLVNGKTKMEIAKETIESFVASLPEETNIGLRVYGHKGTGTDKDKKLSCSSSELVYPLQSYDESKFNGALNDFKPAGWTPIALALKEAQKDLSKYPAKSNTNIIYLVSDGIATCGGNPVRVGKDLADSNINPIVNVIGFDIDVEGQQQLKSISKAMDGIYADAKNKDELIAQMDRTEEIAEKWERWKSHSMYKANDEHFTNTFDILSFINEWQGNKLDEEDNMLNTWRSLRDQGIITEEAYDYLEKKAGKQRKLVNGFHEKMEDEFESLNENNYKAAKKAIKSSFKQNVPQ